MSASRCSTLTGLIFLIIALGCGTASQLLNNWLEFWLSQDIPGSGTIKVTYQIGIWKSCATLGASDDGAALNFKNCSSDATQLGKRRYTEKAWRLTQVPVHNPLSLKSWVQHPTEETASAIRSFK